MLEHEAKSVEQQKGFTDAKSLEEKLFLIDSILADVDEPRRPPFRAFDCVMNRADL
jgi:hypothetical protein